MNSARWGTGLTLSQFLEGMTTNREAMDRRLSAVTLLEQDRDDLVQLTQPIHVLVMTEDWCGDSVMNLPILVRMAEVVPHMDLRVFIRSQVPDLNDY